MQCLRVGYTAYKHHHKPGQCDQRHTHFHRRHLLRGPTKTGCKGRDGNREVNKSHYWSSTVQTPAGSDWGTAHHIVWACRPLEGIIRQCALRQIGVKFWSAEAGKKRLMDGVSCLVPQGVEEMWDRISDIFSLGKLDPQTIKRLVVYQICVPSVPMDKTWESSIIVPLILRCINTEYIRDTVLNCVQVIYEKWIANVHRQILWKLIISDSSIICERAHCVSRLKISIRLFQ